MTISPKESALKLPHNPGVYRFYDQEDILLYVGKAKDLKNRVSSYFNQSSVYNRKTQKLVSQIVRIEYTLVNSEFDALLLENNLIKTHQPKYNILLKDDKTFPYVCITKERFPKVIVTRTVDRKVGKYYGPYSNVKAMHMILDLVKELYTIRTCHLNLTDQNIKAGKFKVCLEYHIGNCKGPCEGHQTEEDYQKDIDQVHQIMKGDISVVKAHFTAKMMEASEKLEFEKAADYKAKLNLLAKFQSKSLVVNPKITDVDVFSIISDEKAAYINYLKIKDGAIVYTHNFDIKKRLDEPDEEILTLIVSDARQEFDSQAKEIITNIPLQVNLLQTESTIPKIGDKKKLLDLSLKNAFFFKKDKDRKQINQQKRDAPAAVQELQKILNMPKPPVHIECFDNSNIQGTNPVASMVYFKNGKPFKKEYRHFNIKTVVGPDDFSSMHEIVSRRYKRLLEEKKELPDLIIIDGGKGQLNAACRALEEQGLYGQIKIVGIAKRLEEIYLPKDDIPLHIHKKSPALKLIQHARDEAHRFAIEFHRLKRSKSSIQSELENIKGIGASTVEKLLQHFKSLKKIKEADIQEVTEVVGLTKAKLIQEYFQ